MRVKQEECESCGRKQGELHKAVIPTPDMETLASWTSTRRSPRLQTDVSSNQTGTASTVTLAGS